MMAGAKKVLFLCTGNSVRSQMAEGLLNALGSGQWKAKSGGVISSYVHPLAIQVMGEIGIDISKKTSKSMDQFINEKFDYVITLCDHAAEFCPTFGGQGRRLHWPFEDPAGATGTTEERLAIFRKIRDEIKKKIKQFLEPESSEPIDPIASFKF
jgi:arsenate reductase